MMQRYTVQTVSAMPYWGIYNSIEHDLATPNQGPELSVSENLIYSGGNAGNKLQACLVKSCEVHVTHGYCIMAFDLFDLSGCVQWQMSGKHILHNAYTYTVLSTVSLLQCGQIVPLQ